MGVLGAEPPAADADDACVKVEVRPLEPEHLALPEAEGQGDHPAGGVPPLPGGQQNALDLLHRVRLDLLLFKARRLGDLGDVHGEVAPADRFAEGHPECAVGLVGSGGLAAAVLHLLVEALQVLRLQLDEAVGAQAGYEVDADGDLVAGDGVLGDADRGDVLDPVGEPRLDCPGLAGLADGAGVALFFQFADELGDLGAGLAGDVAAVGGAVVLDADGHAAVPAAVLPLVNGGGTVGLAGVGHVRPPQAAVVKFGGVAVLLGDKDG